MEIQPQKLFNLEHAKTQIVTLRKNIGQGLIALGQWLVIVKENLPVGEWMEFLREVKIPYITAYRCIKISNEIDYKTLETVGAGKLFEIFELPPSTFRKNLMELAPSLSEKEIREKVKEYKKENQVDSNSLPAIEGEVTTPKQEEVIVNNTDSSVFADTALKFNASFLDSLLHIDLDSLEDYYLELISSQLKKSIKLSVNFIERIESVKQSRT